MNSQIEARQGNSNHQKTGKNPQRAASKLRNQISPYHDRALGMTARQPTAAHLHKRPDPGIITIRSLPVVSGPLSNRYHGQRTTDNGH